MAFALNPELPPCLLDNLIVADIAPSKGTLSAEFMTYIKAMKEIEAAGVFTSKEALKILHRYEKVRLVLLLLFFAHLADTGPKRVRLPSDQHGEIRRHIASQIPRSNRYPRPRDRQPWLISL